LWKSAIVPGWGQIYNGKWWKAPILYGGFTFIVWLYQWNDGYYREFLQESQLRANNLPPNNPLYARTSYEKLVEAKDFYLRHRDLTLFSFFALWGANMIDAYVDARFFQFDISDDLTFSIKPQVMIAPSGTIEPYSLTPKYGLELIFRL